MERTLETGTMAGTALESSPLDLAQVEVAVDAAGQATFSLPIDVPPGIGEAAPKLAFTYQSRQGNGVMGVGWSCSGLSAITRSKPTYMSDGFNGPVKYGPTDRFQFDGQSLIAVKGEYGAAGTVYFTDVQSWRHVQEQAGGFVVTERNGEVRTYGMTPDSRILAHDTTTVRLWALSAVEDRCGNRIEFRYLQGDAIGGGDNRGAYYPDEIRYTVREGRTGPCRVRFHYEDRPDIVVDYMAGAPIVVSKRLKAVTTHLQTPSGIGDVLSYDIAYEVSAATRLSRVIAITQRGADEGDPSLMRAKLHWTDSAAGLGAPGPACSLNGPGPTIFPMDVTGGGRTEMVQFWVDRETKLQASVYRPQLGPDGVSFVHASDSVLGAFPPTRQVLPADVDGDGRTDLIVAFQHPRGRTAYFSVFLARDTGFVEAPGSPFATDAPLDTSHLRFFAMDANGDGRTDIVQAFSNRSGQLCFRTWLSRFGTGSGFTAGEVSTTNDPASPRESIAFWAMDVNGDGMMDLVRAWRGADSAINITSYIAVSRNLEDVTFTARTNTRLDPLNLSESAFLPVDVTGNGIQDLLHVWKAADGRALHLTTFLSDGAGAFVEGPETAFPNENIDPRRLYPMGLVGRGQVSLVSPWTDAKRLTHFTIFQGSPSGKFRVVEPGPPVAIDPDAYFLPCDPDGNGKADLVHVSGDRDRRPAITAFLSLGAPNDLVAEIENGIGGVVKIDYAPLSDADVYSATAAPTNAFPASAALRYPHPLTPTQFPAQAVLGQALYVVKGMTRCEENAKSPFAYEVRSSMSYSDARIDLLGHGWQGFRSVTSIDQQTGAVERHVFNQDFPLTGTIAERRIEADGRYATDPRVPKDRTVLMRAVQTDYMTARPDIPGFGPSKSVQVLAIAQRTTFYDYGAENFDYQLLEKFAYDAFGSRSKSTYLGYVSEGSDEPLVPDAVVYRHNTYRNDVFPSGRWALGFPECAKESTNAEDAGCDTFRSGDLKLTRQTYFDDTYLLKTEANWDDQNGVFLTTAYDYDALGNLTAETRPGGFITKHGYDDYYGAFRTRTTSPPNLQGLSLVTEHGVDPRFGTEIAAMGPSGAITVAAFDSVGRRRALQGPPPSGATATDENRLGRFVATSEGLADRFRNAPVVTLETVDYSRDGAGLHVSGIMALQSFPTSAVREITWERSYFDGRTLKCATIRQSGQTAGDVLMLDRFDSAGRPISQGLPIFAHSIDGAVSRQAIATTYDVLGRPISRRSPAGREGADAMLTTWRYDRDGRETETQGAGSDAAFVTVRDHRVVHGEDRVVRSVTGSARETTSFVYDRLARLIRSTDPATPSNPQGVTSTTEYDSLDRPICVDNPDQNTTGDGSAKAMRYVYSSVDGLIATTIDAANSTTIFRHDGLGRLVERAFSDGSRIVLLYDGADEPNAPGYLTRATRHREDGAVESERKLGYDVYGNVVSERVAIAGEAELSTTRVFDPQKRMVRENFPGGGAAMLCFAFGRLVEARLADLPDGLAGVAVAYPLDDFHPTGRPQKVKYGGGAVDGSAVVGSYDYNPAGLLYHESLVNAEGSVLDETYTYDALNQILGIMAGDPGTGPKRYAYRDRRLVSASAPGFDDERFSYDASSNMTSKGGVDYQFRGHFAHTGLRDGAVVYSAKADPCGRTILRAVDGVTQAFDYDCLGRLKRIKDADGSTLAEMLYSDTGRLLKRSEAEGDVTLFIGSSYELRRSADGSISTTRYLSAGRGAIAKATSGAGAASAFQRRDHKGNVTHVFSHEGALGSVIGYAAYGEFVLLKEGSEPARLYEGKLWNRSASLYDFRARFYDPISGRFLTPDNQIGGESLYQQGMLNRFAFELNNPIGNVDPTGHLSSGLSAFLGALIGVVAVVVGIAIIAATGGAAAPVLGAVGAVLGTIIGGALLTGGTTAFAYSVTHTGDFDWKSFGIELGVSAAVGAVSGGLLYGANAALGATAATLAKSWGPYLLNTFASGVLGSAGDVLGQLATNAAEDRDLTTGLATVAVIGIVAGSLGGFLGTGVHRVAEKQFEKTAEKLARFGAAAEATYRYFRQGNRNGTGIAHPSDFQPAINSQGQVVPPQPGRQLFRNITSEKLQIARYGVALAGVSNAVGAVADLGEQLLNDFLEEELP